MNILDINKIARRRKTRSKPVNESVSNNTTGAPTPEAPAPANDGMVATPAAPKTMIGVQRQENQLRDHIYTLMENFRNNLGQVSNQLKTMQANDSVPQELMNAANTTIKTLMGELNEALQMTGGDRSSPGFHMATNFLGALRAYAPQENAQGMQNMLQEVWKNVMVAEQNASQQYDDSYQQWQKQVENGQGTMGIFDDTKEKNPSLKQVYEQYGGDPATRKLIDTIVNALQQN